MAKTSKKGTEDTVEFIATAPIKHDGDDYRVGEVITLTQKEAVILLDLSVIKSSEVAESNAPTEESEAVDLGVEA